VGDNKRYGIRGESVFAAWLNKKSDKERRKYEEE